jgi:hypoxia up-regulated 1
MASRFLFWTVCFISILVVPTWASVLAIDFGTDWIKASLLKPGVPFDVLLNKDSKRKIHSSVGWNREDRLFGTDAYNIVSASLSLYAYREGNFGD